jgi:hypothetical protein
MLRYCDQRSGGFTMTKSNLRLVSPHAVIGTVPPRRVPNAELRTREYLTEAEALKRPRPIGMGSATRR